jgi:hypothetical protein
MPLGNRLKRVIISTSYLLIFSFLFAKKSLIMNRFMDKDKE